MHVARENYGSSLQDFIIDGSGVYITRNSNSYVTGRMELSNNICYRNGINGVVVHKTNRVHVKNNVIFDNGQVPRDAPQSRQAYAGLTINNSEDVTVYNNSVITTLADDYAYAISGTTYGFIDEFGVDRTAPENVNRHCGGMVKSDFGDRVIEGVVSGYRCELPPTPSPTSAPTSTPTAKPTVKVWEEKCEDEYAESLPEGKTWSSYVTTCGRDLGGACFSHSSFCEGEGDVWHAAGYCGSGALGIGCGCCVQATGSPTPSPTASPTDRPTASPTASPTDQPTAAPTPGPTPAPTVHVVQEMCEDENWAVALPDGKSWNSYTWSCRKNLGGACYSDESFCDTAGGDIWFDSGYCGNAALGVSCGCCVAATSSPTPAPVPRTARPTVDGGTSYPTASPTSSPTPFPTPAPSSSQTTEAPTATPETPSPTPVWPTPSPTMSPTMSPTLDLPPETLPDLESNPHVKGSLTLDNYKYLGPAQITGEPPPILYSSVAMGIADALGVQRKHFTWKA